MRIFLILLMIITTEMTFALSPLKGDPSCIASLKRNQAFQVKNQIALSGYIIDTLCMGNTPDRATECMTGMMNQFKEQGEKLGYAYVCSHGTSFQQAKKCIQDATQLLPSGDWGFVQRVELCSGIARHYHSCTNPSTSCAGGPNYPGAVKGSDFKIVPNPKVNPITE